MIAGQLAEDRPAAHAPAQALAVGIGPAPVIAFCGMFALVLFLPPILDDGDTLWQIRTGEWILNHLAIPATDPFSSPPATGTGSPMSGSPRP